MLEIQNTEVSQKAYKNLAFKKEKYSTLPPRMQQPMVQQPPVQQVPQYQTQQNQQTPVQPRPQQMYQQPDTFVMQNKKEKNKEKWEKAGVIGQVGLAVAFCTMALYTALTHKHQKAATIAQEEYFKAQTKALKGEVEESMSKAKDFLENITNASSIDEMCLSDDMKELLEKSLKNINDPMDIQRRGGSPLKSFLLYGPPGTGKTTFAKAFAKRMDNADFGTLDIGQLKDKWLGGTEKNISQRVEAYCELADKYKAEYLEKLKEVIGKDIVEKGDAREIAKALELAKKEGKEIPKSKKVVVFCDEIDSVMMVDTSENAKHSNDALNEFKKAFTEKLGKRDNIITIGATNIEIDSKKAMESNGKRLDKPMLDRFQSKILVGNPNSKQIQNKIIKHYKDCDKVSDNLKKDSKQLKVLSDFLAEKKHETSFRSIESILRDVADSTAGTSEKVDFKDFIKSLRTKKEELHLTDSEINSLASKLGVRKK